MMQWLLCVLLKGSSSIRRNSFSRSTLTPFNVKRLPCCCIIVSTYSMPWLLQLLAAVQTERVVVLFYGFSFRRQQIYDNGHENFTTRLLLFRLYALRAYSALAKNLTFFRILCIDGLVLYGLGWSIASSSPSTVQQSYHFQYRILKTKSLLRNQLMRIFT